MIKLEEAFNKYYKQLEEQRLDEVNRFDAKNLNPSDTSLFKFFVSPVDLLNALKTKTIWSAYYDNNNGQYDAHCDELKDETGHGWEYICFTTEPTKVALEFRRPFGIEFNKDKFINDINKKGYDFKDFNQFIAKTRKTNQETSNKSYNLYLGTVGKWKSGEYFYTIQGGYTTRTIDEQTYRDLVEWLNNNVTDNQLVHFINNVDNPLATYKKAGKSSTPQYVYTIGDFVAKDSLKSFTKTDTNKKGETIHTCSNGCFGALELGAGFQFTSEFRDIAELYAVVLNREVGLQALKAGAYATHLNNTACMPPILDPKLNLGSDSNLSERTYKVLGDTLNEYESRVYVPENHDFIMSLNTIDKLQLPRVLEFFPSDISSKANTLRYLPLEELYKIFENESNLSDDELVQICNDRFNIKHEYINKSVISLFRFIKTKNLYYDFFDYSIDIKNKTTGNNYLYTFDTEDTHTKFPVTLERQRYFTDLNSILQVKNEPVYDYDKNPMKGPLDPSIKLIKINDADGYPTLLYTAFNPRNNEMSACARIGVEGIVLAKDDEGNWYIRLMNKSKTFSELPGGSLPNLDNLSNQAKEKISGEVGYNLSSAQFNGPITCIYMYEGNLVIDNTIKRKLIQLQLNYPYSAYLIFTCILNETIAPDEKSYYTKERDVARWAPVETLYLNKNFMTRYSNLLDIIKNLTE